MSEPTPDAGPYSIGGSPWPGLSRVTEEAGELLQVVGKIVGAGGRTDHWDGTDLRQRLIEEVADVQAALTYLTEANDLPAEMIAARYYRKLGQYRRWHEQATGNWPGSL